MAERNAERLDRSGYRLEVEDDFASATLDQGLWLPNYLPQWSSRAASAARYALADGMLRLRIDADQQPWCPEWDSFLRVSSLQTGVFAGPPGSRIGQHRFAGDMVVREAQEPRSLYTPHYGLIEVRARAVRDPANMVALWMIGFEDQPQRSAEICVVELFGRDVLPDVATVGMGVRPFGDPAIANDFERVTLPIDATAFHEYAAAWTPEGVAFYVDGRLAKAVDQSPAYPMQLMLSIYEFRDGPGQPSPADTYPKEFVVDWVRGWQRTA